MNITLAHFLPGRTMATCTTTKSSFLIDRSSKDERCGRDPFWISSDEVSLYVLPDVAAGVAKAERTSRNPSPSEHRV